MKRVMKCIGYSFYPFAIVNANIELNTVCIYLANKTKKDPIGV